MKPNRLALIASLALASSAALILSGCGASNSATDASQLPDDQAASEAAPGADANSTGAPGTGNAELSYRGVTYTAELQFCSLRGAEEALFHGPAFDESGDSVGYLSGDFMGLGDIPSGEARINFGATKDMQSTDEFVALGGAGGHIVITDSSDTSLIVMGATWEQSGAELPTGTLKVTC